MARGVRVWGVGSRKWFEVQSGEMRLAGRLSHCVGAVQRAHGFVCWTESMDEWEGESRGVLKQTIQMPDYGTDVLMVLLPISVAP